MVFKDGSESEKILGADVKKLQAVHQDLSKIAGGDGTNSDSARVSWRSASLAGGMSDVTDQVELKGLELLNADHEFGTVRTLIDEKKPSALDSKGKASEEKDWVQSDTDEQLMLYIPFQAHVKIHTIQVCQ